MSLIPQDPQKPEKSESQLSSDQFSQFLEIQRNEIEIRAQELRLRNDDSNRAHEFAKARLAAEERDRENERTTNFVRRMLRVPKHELDESIRKERQEQKEKDKDPLEEKQREKEKGSNS